MKSGYSRVARILSSYGMKAGEAIGTVWSVGREINMCLTNKGFSIEGGILHPTYDYIVIGKSKSSVVNIARAINKLNSNGILVVIASKNDIVVFKKGG